MKKSSVLMIVAAIMLSSCGTFSQLITSGDNQQFQDGIYSNVPDFRSREEKDEGRLLTEALAAETKESPIYLFGDRKDTVMIPENFSATIKYDKPLSSTVITITENPYDWRNNIDPWSFYAGYTLGNSWYWNRHWDPYWYGPSWHYAWSDPWYYGGYWGRWYDPWSYWNRWGWHDPWHYGGHWGWYDPWYYGGYWSPYHRHYYGWYGGLGPHWGHHHGHGGPGHGHGGHFSKDRWYGPRHETVSDQRVFTDNQKTTVKRGIGSSSSTSRGTVRGSSVSRNTSASKVTPTEGSAARRTVAGRNSAATVSPGKTVSTGQTSSTTTRTYRRPSVTDGSSSSYVSRESGSSSTSRSTVSRSTSSSTSSSSYQRNSSGSSTSRTSSYTPSRSSSYSSGSSGSYSRGSSGGGYSGGGASRSGGSWRKKIKTIKTYIS